MTYQMRSDISNGHHKYMAHQSALLFVSEFLAIWCFSCNVFWLYILCNLWHQTQRSLTPFEFGPRFKKRIQQRFAEVCFCIRNSISCIDSFHCSLKEYLKAIKRLACLRNKQYGICKSFRSVVHSMIAKCRMETILDDIIQFVESHPPSVRKMMGPMAKFVGGMLVCKLLILIVRS
jgi:hypothetical protein